MTAKEYYRNYTGDNLLRDLNRRLLAEIEVCNPKSVLEFGCGQSKHLAVLNEKGFTTCGIDISFSNIMHGYCNGNLNTNAILSDEKILEYLQGFDLVFTCSVLCHIKYIDRIVENFKRIAPVIILAETKDLNEDFYFIHDYEAMGFEVLSSGIKSPGNGCEYILYRWKR